MKFFILLALVLFPTLVLAKFSHESEVSMVKTGGNSEVQTTNTKTTNKYEWSTSSFTFGGHYTYGDSDRGVTVRNWDVNAKYEREITPKLSLVAGEIVEGNQFISIKARYNTDLGLRYYYIKSDPKKFFSEVTYRYTIEDRYEPEPNTYDNKGRLYNEFFHKYSETLQYKIWVDYIPNFTDGKDYLINGEASVTAILTSIFSLKVAYMGMYDNKPAKEGFKNYDYATTTALVAKF